MASTGAVLYIRPRAGVSVKAGHRTGAVIHLSARVVSGVYSASGVVASINQVNRRTWLPHISTPVVGPDGRMSDEWYRFFDYWANTKQGGASSPTIPDLASTVSTAQEQAASASTAATGLSQQVSQNAEALATTVEVARNNSLTGAAQIPPVQRTNQMVP